ncbi:MAG: hypothetical protein WBA91_01610 [Paracoccaceae bacterium]
MRIGLFRPAATARQRSPRRRRAGSLFILALFLGLSGVLKVGSGIGRAMATTPPDSHEGTAPQSCESGEGAAALMEALALRESRLAEREALVAEQSKTVELAKAGIAEKIAALEAAEANLAATIALADKAAEKDVAKLVAMYENMKPKQAADLFAEMDPEFAAGFLAQMSPPVAAAILAGIAPDRAYNISVVLAGRNAKAPKS